MNRLKHWIVLAGMAGMGLFLLASEALAADPKLRKAAPLAPQMQSTPAMQVQKPKALHPGPAPLTGGVGIRTATGFDFSTTAIPGTTGIRTVAGFDFSTQATPGTTGIRTVNGLDFSTQAEPGTTGMRTVTGFDFTKQ